MGMYKNTLFAVMILGALSCTSVSEGEVGTPPADLNRRVRYRGNASANLRERMDEQASEINRKRNIEEFDRNLPATTPTPLRPLQVPDAPVDSVHHNVQRPINTKVPPR